MTALDDLREFLRPLPVGPVNDLSGLRTVLAAAWSSLDGARETLLYPAPNLLQTITSATWDSPRLELKLNRLDKNRILLPDHDVPGPQTWRINVDEGSVQLVHRTPASRTTTASSIPLTDIRWLWAGRIPFGKLTLLVGAGDIGKSTLMAELAARVTVGDALPGEPDGPKPRCDVLMLGYEDDPGDTTNKRLLAAGADLERVHHWLGTETVTGTGSSRKVERDRLSFPSHAGQLEEEIVACGAGLVVVDPVDTFWDERINPNSAASARRALGPLADVAQRTGAAVLLTLHTTKTPNSTAAMYRGSGSAAIANISRAVHVSARDPDNADRVIIAPAKMNVGPLPDGSFAYYLVADDRFDCSRIVWDGESSLTADELMSTPTKAQTSALAAATAWLGDLLAGGPVLANQAKSAGKIAGHSEASVMRAKSVLGVESIRAPGGGRHAPWVWRLPPT